MENIDNFKKKSELWFKKLRNEICSDLESIENNNGKNKLRFKKKNGLEIIKIMTLVGVK